MINDRLDIALALGVGLHVGQSDMEISLVRKLLGDKVILGVSINTTEELDIVIAGGWADYVGCGPVHFTRSKDVLSPILGGRGISKILKHLALNPLKIVAIGTLI